MRVTQARRGAVSVHRSSTQRKSSMRIVAALDPLDRPVSCGWEDALARTSVGAGAFAAAQAFESGNPTLLPGVASAMALVTSAEHGASRAARELVAEAGALA